MRLNRPTIHTIDALIWIAQRNNDGALIGGPEIAKKFKLPKQHMGPMLRSATRAGILHAAKGPNGGYRLARPAVKITLLEIIEAASGRIDGGLHSKNEALTTALAIVAARERQVLGDVTLADLAGNACVPRSRPARVRT
jgi:Rrf2 family protein